MGGRGRSEENGGGVGGRGKGRSAWEGEGGVRRTLVSQVMYMNGNVLLGLSLCCTVSEYQYFEPRVCCITNWCSLVRI